MASYNYAGLSEDYVIIHMIFTIMHVAIANILLLNYLIAILSQSYSVMLENGVFLYKVYLFQYCERYIVAMRNKAYGELVKHPAPIILLNIPIFILSCIPGIPKPALESISEYFSYFIFWLDNIVLLAVFLLYEVILCPLCYLKNIPIVILSS